MLIGLMSLPNQVVYIQFHPVAYMVKLNIELSMASLITKLAYRGLSDDFYSNSLSYPDDGTYHEEGGTQMNGNSRSTNIQMLKQSSSSAVRKAPLSDAVRAIKRKEGGIRDGAGGGAIIRLPAPCLTHGGSSDNESRTKFIEVEEDAPLSRHTGPP